MQKYKCHKVVKATKIEYVGDDLVRGDDTLMYDKPKTCRATKDDMGYLVEYEDGYRSWSPSKPFEDGYSLITE